MLQAFWRGLHTSTGFFHHSEVSGHSFVILLIRSEIINNVLGNAYAILTGWLLASKELLHLLLSHLAGPSF